MGPETLILKIMETLRNLKITKKDLINLCLNCDIHFNTQFCYPEHISTNTWELIDNILNTSKVSKAMIKRKLASIDDIILNWGFQTLEDIKSEFEIDNNLEAIEMLKTLIVKETIERCYMELLYKKMVNGFGRCYVPETLAISPEITLKYNSFEK